MLELLEVKDVVLQSWIMAAHVFHSGTHHCHGILVAVEADGNWGCWLLIHYILKGLKRWAKSWPSCKKRPYVSFTKIPWWTLIILAKKVQWGVALYLKDCLWCLGLLIMFRDNSRKMIRSFVYVVSRWKLILPITLRLGYLQRPFGSELESGDLRFSLRNVESKGIILPQIKEMMIILFDPFSQHIMMWHVISYVH